MSAITTPTRVDLIDQLIQLYCDWREECTEAKAAYERFSDANPVDRPLAYAAYAAALDREESAARTYASHLELIITTHPEMSEPRPHKRLDVS